MRVFTPPVSALCAAQILLCQVLAGCSTPGARRLQSEPEGAGRPKPELLYLLPSPHSRLYVEVDAVEGCQPKAEALQQLRAFLSTYGRKPDGVEVVRSDMIPVDAARGLSERALARKYLTGPPKTDPSSPAFLYILFYNDAYNRNTPLPKVTPPGATLLMIPNRKVANPYAEVLPYPAIYFNTGFSLGMAENEILLHETGHLLGLVNRQLKARHGHCRNSGCQMNTHIDYLLEFRWLPGREQSSLCSQCVAELTQRSTHSPALGLRYVGPVLVRAAADYHVLTLPGRLAIFVGSLTDQDCQDFAAAMLHAAPAEDRRRTVYCFVKDDSLADPAALDGVFVHLKDDPFEPLRQLGPGALVRFCAERYGTLGQYSNAVALLHRSIQDNPKDGWSYNQLAWIKATCSDATIRNGTDAISAATTACELTGWKNGRFLDTLAAAYAESRDFDRAIEFQQRAMRAGHATAVEFKQMQDRLSLYQRATPFREGRNRQ